MKPILLSTCLCIATVILAAAAWAETPAEAMSKKLDHPSITGPLKDAFGKIGKLAGVKIVPDWDAIKASGVKEDERVVVKASQATAEQVLELLLSQVAASGEPLAWYADSEAVHVTTQMRVMYRKQLARTPLSLVTTQDAGDGKGEKKRTSVGKDKIAKLNFDGMPLEDVLTFLRQVADVNMTVNWKSLEEIKVDRKTPVSLTATDISAARALDLVLDQLTTSRDKMQRVYWVVDEGVVVVATGAALDQKTVTRIYGVGDVLTVVPNFKGPKINLQSDLSSGGGTTGVTGGAGGGGNTGVFTSDPIKAEEENTVENRKEMQEAFVGVVKDSIGADMWQPTGKGSIRIFRGQMIVTQTLLGFKLMEASGTAK